MKSAAAVILAAGLAWAARPDAAGLSPVTIDYPEEGAVFPPEITPPTFLWRDAAENARAWLIEVTFTDGSPAIRIHSPGDRLHVGEIDPRCVSGNNELPRLTPQQAAARTWIPDSAVWSGIKKHSVGHPAKLTISGFSDRKLHHAVSHGSVAIRTSEDPVGAPIFYRDVPLMPAELEKGVIKPLAPAAIPLINWRLRDIAEPRSQVVLSGMHTCANCHSFSADGKTMGMDLDGPQNDKGLYAIAAVQPAMSIRDEDIITWKSFRDQPSGPMRVGFMSAISPDGRYVVTTVGVEQDLSRNFYVANFKNYRFLQVFYATRGVLTVYDRTTGQRHSLPGADDPRYVQTNATWSRDGKYLVFARAEAKDAYPEGRKLAEYANDPNETEIRYDLYRVPFNGGQGGQAEPIAGASRNGMSNSFPKVSPDGRWIVFVQAHNGLLMRPDSQLYIVPAAGGVARRLRANTPLMNSWHSFSPNGRWLVFSSKAHSPYTQMYLTHIDQEGNDTPAILIEGSTAANRAVNLPEFVNIPPGGLAKIEVPAAEFYTRFDRAWELAEKGQHEAAAAAWRSALELHPDDARANNNLAFALARLGKLDEAIACWEIALRSNDQLPEVRENLARGLESLGLTAMKKGAVDEALPNLRRAEQLDPADAGNQYNLGLALLRKSDLDGAIAHFHKALDLDPRPPQTHNDLGVALSLKRRFDEAVVHFRAAIAADPQFAQAQSNLAWLLATSPEATVRNGAGALELAAKAVELSHGTDSRALDALAAAYAETGRFPEAVETARRALDLAEQPLVPALKARIAMYQRQEPFREK
ncbi:MAG TPA: tetratricopeptide repeat protein [Bryobacteraceae bacterium]|nr:tetratricopeptide repeat protein [Bryobacteraceae bacterium]